MTTNKIQNSKSQPIAPIKRRKKSFSDCVTHVNIPQKKPLTWINDEDILEGLGTLLHCSIDPDSSNTILDEVWSEYRFPLDNINLNLTKRPEKEFIVQTISSILKKDFMNIDCCIMALAYIDRIIKNTGIKLQPKNWRRLLLGSLMMATKVYEDEAVWNVDFIESFPNLHKEDLMVIERSILRTLDYNVHIKTSTYARYYFELSAVSQGQYDRFEDGTYELNYQSIMKKIKQYE